MRYSCQGMWRYNRNTFTWERLSYEQIFIIVTKALKNPRCKLFLEYFTSNKQNLIILHIGFQMPTDVYKIFCVEIFYLFICLTFACSKSNVISPDFVSKLKILVDAITCLFLLIFLLLLLCLINYSTFVFVFLLSFFSLLYSWPNKTTFQLVKRYIWFLNYIISLRFYVKLFLTLSSIKYVYSFLNNLKWSHFWFV